MRYHQKCWRLWVLRGCLGWHASSTLRGGRGRCRRSGKRVWWSLSLRRGTRGCVPITEVSHYSACLGKSTPTCWKGGSSRLSNLGLTRNNVDSVQAVEQQTRSLVWKGSWRGPRSTISQSTCVLWIWRRRMTGSPGMFCGRSCGSMGWGGPFSGPSNPYILKARAACVYSEVSRTCSKWVLASARAVPCPKSCLWYTWTGFWGAVVVWRGLQVVTRPEDCITAFCRWCGLDGTISCRSTTLTGLIVSWVCSGRDEDQHL